MQGWSDRTVAIPEVETKLSHGPLSTIPPWTVEDLGRDRGGEAWPHDDRPAGKPRSASRRTSSPVGLNGLGLVRPHASPETEDG
jgi:hypothetical protein